MLERIGIQLPPCTGQLNRLPQPIKQGNAHLLFQLLDVGGNGSLRILKRLSSLGEAIQVCNGFKRLELANFQDSFLLYILDIRISEGIHQVFHFETAGFYEDAYREDVLEFIRAFDRQGKVIASICVGALPVGKSGVLEGRCATTYNLNNRLRQKQLADMGVHVIPDNSIVVDQNIITSYNPSTAFDVAFKLLESLTSRENTEHVKRLMGFIK